METYRLEMNKEEFLGMLSNYFTSKLGKQNKDVIIDLIIMQLEELLWKGKLTK